MHHFFVQNKPDEEGLITITDEALKHMSVLRLRPGEEVTVSDGEDRDYYCTVVSAERECVVLKVGSNRTSTELPVQITLYQGFPKADKMEMIIQKAVELGAMRIVPTMMARCVARPDEKRLRSRLERWNQIARSAAEQSGRSSIPTVEPATSLKQAVKDAGSGLMIVPYESADGMRTAKEVLQNLKEGHEIAVFIGPEGGFDPDEIELCMNAGAKIISLGRRILRTETAGLVALSALMLAMEMKRDGE